MIYVFKSGNVVECGSHDDLMKQKGHYYDMVMLQNLGAEENTGIYIFEESMNFIFLTLMCMLSVSMAYLLYYVSYPDRTDTDCNIMSVISLFLKEIER